MHRDALQRLAAIALQKGGRFVSRTTIEWEAHLDCIEPVRLEHFARKDREGNSRQNRWNPGDVEPLRIFMSAPCRKCVTCLRRRSRLWYSRARAETAQAGRTWFGTLTLSPQSHWEIELRARARLARGAVPWSSLSDRQQFVERHAEISREITLYLKRVRFSSAANLRYLCVAEQHKSGLPHYHLLIHECLLSPVTKATLQAQWQLGFSSMKLVQSPKSVGYTTKYIAKSVLARVRASIRYGHGFQRNLPISHDRKLETSVSVTTPPKLRYTLEETFE